MWNNQDGTYQDGGHAPALEGGVAPTDAVLDLRGLLRCEARGGEDSLALVRQEDLAEDDLGPGAVEGGLQVLLDFCISDSLS